MKKKSVVNGALQETCYIVYDEETKNALLIDPGEEGEKIAEVVEREGLTPVAMLLTHGHFDHGYAADYLRARYGIKAYISEKEKEMPESSELNLSDSFLGYSLVYHVDEIFREGDVLSFPEVPGISLRVIATPGHTPGGVCLYDENLEWLFSGDTLFYHSYGRTDFSYGNEAELFRSIREKLLTLPDTTRVYPGHGYPTTIGKERGLF